MHTSKLLAAAGLVAVALGAQNSQAQEKKEMEKCYGIVKAGHNDCSNAAGTHSCAGQAKTDSDGGEWVLLPRGLCDRIVGGSMKPKA